jgi:hypothetical protein
MSGEAVARAARLPFWKGWTPREAAFELISPLLVLASIGWCIHLVQLGLTAMFDDENVGPTVVGTLAFAIAAIAGGYGTSLLLASIRSVVLRGACPCCGEIRHRTFEEPANTKSPPTPCGACIAYLRATGDEIREEALEQFEMIRTPYVLTAAQYKPAAKRTHRGYFTFQMPTMCAVCGAPHAPHKREIGNGDSLGSDLGALGAVVAVAADVSGTPSWSQKDHVLPLVGSGSTSEPTEAEKNSHGLSHLKAPVCDKHTASEKPFGTALEYNSGKLEFAGYRFYKAFCELNHIERVPAS